MWYRHVSRLTVWANQERRGRWTPRSFPTIVTSDQPVVAERAMYRAAPGERFAAGSVASGIAVPDDRVELCRRRDRRLLRLVPAPCQSR